MEVNVELSMQDTPGDDIQFYDVDVYVVAPNQALATYIVATMYPDYESLCIDDEPTSNCPLIFHTKHPKVIRMKFSSFKRNLIAIWLCNHAVFSYT